MFVCSGGWPDSTQGLLRDLHSNIIPSHACQTMRGKAPTSCLALQLLYIVFFFNFLLFFVFSLGHTFYSTHNLHTFVFQFKITLFNINCRIINSCLNEAYLIHFFFWLLITFIFFPLGKLKQCSSNILEGHFQLQNH